MVGIKKRAPTNKEFRNHFQDFASTKTKKGHLNSKSQKSKNSKEIGVLVRIIRDKLYENGWEVEVGTGKKKKTYMCSLDSSVLYIPDSEITEKYLVPKQKTEVEITIDTKSQIYRITKIKSRNIKPIALFEDVLTISTNTNTDTNSDVSASIELSKDTVNIKSDNVKITDSNNKQIDLIGLQIEVETLNQEKQALWEKIENIEKQVTIQQSNEENNNGE